mgnify:CR=1 FL=1
MGYKVHLTESCEAELPLVITHVETTAAPETSEVMTATIHAELERKHLVPAEHIVDTGYVDAQLLVESQRDYQINLVGPTRKDCRWQANQRTGFDASHFLIDWDQQQATWTARAHEQQLGSGPGQVEQRDHPDPVLDQRLSAMPLSFSLYPF